MILKDIDTEILIQKSKIKGAELNLKQEQVTLQRLQCNKLMKEIIPVPPPKRIINESCFCFFHKWRTHEKTELYEYKQCTKCGKLKTIQLYSGGYSPIKCGWPKPNGRFN